MRWSWVALAVTAGACADSKVPPRGLRVPLPDGWVANAGARGVLEVGPKGRVVLTLERRAAPLPALESLQAAVVAEGGVVQRAESTSESTLVRYARPPGAGLLQVRTLEARAVLLCGTTPAAAEPELDAAERLCAAVRLEP